MALVSCDAETFGNLTLHAAAAPDGARHAPRHLPTLRVGVALHEVRLPRPTGKKLELRLFAREGETDTILPLDQIATIDVRAGSSRARCDGIAILLSTTSSPTPPRRRLDWLPEPVRRPLAGLARRLRAARGDSARG
ncbi:hypothetical protein CLV28_1377 [Sediminihabitans luteus]|uniref:Uncharacterized protein n=1 Tax=Sediminihabitans luteus TaxID=1138585 RepID=A0A2M9CPS8_9CELL|nr:hypothetical protein [Sediminihabitans luteus]PJJ73893.1 hypothetical protein CLV28_1377 [Sediminihabitans luteus]GII98195.1 hypothetical protein Slu03_05730 [Sediminihabitans luteus]